jgi:EcsC protein family
MGLTSSFGYSLAPKVTQVAPGVTSRAVLEAFNRAVDGIGPLPAAAKAADKQLAEQRGDVERAIHEVIENNVRLAGAQGFVTNVGGLVTLAVALPANITGVALVQCRMIAGIAHLKGYDLAEPRVRNAVLATILGEDHVADLIRRKKLPGTPMALATAPVYDETLAGQLAGEVATVLISKVAGKRLAVAAARRIPVLGGVVGASADSYSTWRAGRYADRELLPRTRR